MKNCSVIINLNTSKHLFINRKTRTNGNEIENKKMEKWKNVDENESFNGNKFINKVD